MRPMTVTGLNGTTIDEAWKEKIYSYGGIALPGFPNLFIDIDTGFGNAVNVAYVVPRYAAAGVAAVVIEDKTFPKDSSLRAGGRQELVPVGKFQGKLAVAKQPAPCW
jgi:hypothetical protein